MAEAEHGMAEPDGGRRSVIEDAHASFLNQPTDYACPAEKITMNALHQMLADLRQLQSISRELLTLAENEAHALRHDGTAELRVAGDRRRELLPRLDETLEKIRVHRKQWQLLTAGERAAQPEIGYLLRQTQDLIMRVVLLDRENEQGLLRRGLIPAREIPSAQQQRPHFVANLYRRQP